MINKNRTKGPAAYRTYKRRPLVTVCSRNLSRIELLNCGGLWSELAIYSADIYSIIAHVSIMSMWHVQDGINYDKIVTRFDFRIAFRGSWRNATIAPQSQVTNCHISNHISLNKQLPGLHNRIDNRAPNTAERR